MFTMPKCLPWAKGIVVRGVERILGLEGELLPLLNSSKPPRRSLSDLQRCSGLYTFVLRKIHVAYKPNDITALNRWISDHRI